MEDGVFETVEQPKIKPSHRCKRASHHQKAETTGGGVLGTFKRLSSEPHVILGEGGEEQSPLEKETVEVDEFPR